MLTVILIILVILSFGAIAWVVVPKLPQLLSFTVDDSPKEKLKRLKTNLVMSRLGRKVKAVEKKIIAPETRRRIGYLVRDSYAKLKVLEENYRASTSEAKIKLMLKRGQDNIAVDSDLAEQCFLDVVSIDKHNLAAYEGLSQIYLSKKSFREAIEILEFLMKLNPASSDKYLFDIAQAYMLSGNLAGAREYGERAIALEPENPRYLDFFAELAILEGNKREGGQFIRKLQRVNPENAKIAEFARRIKDLR